MRFRILRLASATLVAFGALAVPIGAQQVSLEIKPRVGDTLAIRMDQLVEMTGTTRGDPARSLAMETSVFTRAVPERATRTGTVVTGFADSAVMSPRVKGGMATTRRLNGRSTQMHILYDGAAEMMKDDPSNDELREFFGQMPAMLPRNPVAVGSKWTREMPIPVRGGARGSSWVRTTFALDSMTRNGDIAFISLRGNLSHESAENEGADRGPTGTIAGSIQLNRQLGWITDSRVTILLHSLVRNAASARPPAITDAMQVRTKIVQRLRVVRR